MTPTQIQRLEQKIATIKRALMAEKRKFGGYDDSRGLRYLPTRYYLQVGDYTGGLAYTRWFAKAFPYDVGFPDFLFEWTVLLFKAGKLPEAQAKAWQTFCANTYLFDKYFGRPLTLINKYESSSLAQVDFLDSFPYSCKQVELLDFSHWLDAFLSSDLFRCHQSRYLAIFQRLEFERDLAARSCLLKEADQLQADLRVDRPVRS